MWRDLYTVYIHSILTQICTQPAHLQTLIDDVKQIGNLRYVLYCIYTQCTPSSLVTILYNVKINLCWEIHLCSKYRFFIFILYVTRLHFYYH